MFLKGNVTLKIFGKHYRLLSKKYVNIFYFYLYLPSLYSTDLDIHNAFIIIFFPYGLLSHECIQIVYVHISALQSAARE